MSFDLNRVAALLHVVEKAKQWPELRPLHDDALAELRGESSKLSPTAADIAKERAAHAETKSKLDRANEKLDGVQEKLVSLHDRISVLEKKKELSPEIEQAFNALSQRVDAMEKARNTPTPMITETSAEPVRRREVPEEVNHGA